MEDGDFWEEEDEISDRLRDGERDQLAAFWRVTIRTLDKDLVSFLF